MNAVDKSDPFVRLVTATDLLEADLWKAVLESAGIPVYFRQEGIAAVSGITVGELAAVDLWVPRDQAAEGHRERVEPVAVHRVGGRVAGEDLDERRHGEAEHDEVLDRHQRPLEVGGDADAAHHHEGHQRQPGDADDRDQVFVAGRVGADLSGEDAVEQLQRVGAGDDRRRRAEQHVGGQLHPAGQPAHVRAERAAHP